MRIGKGLGIGALRKLQSVSYDADAQAFITAASLTDNTQKSAINTLVLNLKSYGLWTKMKALYPIVGGTAASHLVNLKTPGTYNLSFSTGWTHSSTGMTPSNAYANTNLTPSIFPLIVNNTHISFYSRTSNNLGICDIGQYWANGGTQAYASFLCCGRSSDNNYVAYMYNSDANRINGAQINASGHFINNRISTSNFKLFQNNTIKGSNSNINSTIYQGLGQNSFLISALNYFDNSATPQNQILQYSYKQCAFASIGDGLTDTEATNFYTSVQAYQTTLGRQV